MINCIAKRSHCKKFILKASIWSFLFLTSGQFSPALLALRAS